MKNLDYFIQKLPAVPSYYCRASSIKKTYQQNLVIYQDYTWYTWIFVRKITIQLCRKTVFTKKYNIGFHLPKKDKCNLCSKFDNIKLSSDLNEEQKIKEEKHLEEEEECRQMFLFDQQLSKAGGDFVCSSFDL